MNPRRAATLLTYLLFCENSSAIILFVSLESCRPEGTNSITRDETAGGGLNEVLGTSNNSLT